MKIDDHTIVLDRETDGRFIADIPSLPGVICYGATSAEAKSNVLSLAVHVLEERAAQREIRST